MNLYQTFLENITAASLFTRNDRVLIAVSGGLDSAVLCHLCHTAGFDFVMAHCNFNLRGAESIRDEQFVQDLARQYQRPLLVKSFDTAAFASENKLSIQVAARTLRYAWFTEILDQGDPSLEHDQQNISLLLTAHHLNDNIETLLMNFFKGTGITGLRGMLPKQDRLVRPLLFAGKEQLLAYASENNLQWVEDSSNQSDKYSRNYLRHQLIPVLQQIYPAVETNLADNLQRFRDAAILYEQAVNLHKKKLLQQRQQEIHIPVLKLKKTVPLQAVVYEIIKPYHFSPAQVKEVIALLDSTTGKWLASSTHRIIKNRNWIIIAALDQPKPDRIIIDQPETLELGEGNWGAGPGTWKLSITESPAPVNGPRPFSIPTDPNIAWLQSKEIKFPLILRKYQPGDYFYPLGMKKKKKLSRFMIDQKFSKTQKENSWVIESDKKIIWLAGHRIDDRFKINAQTDRLLQIELCALKE